MYLPKYAKILVILNTVAKMKLFKMEMMDLTLEILLKLNSIIALSLNFLQMIRIIFL